MRFIDADELINQGYEIVVDGLQYDTCDKSTDIDDIPTAYDIDKVIEELEEKTDFLKNCTKYGNKNAEQQSESYSTMMMYEVADLVDDLIEIVKQGGVGKDVSK